MHTIVSKASALSETGEVIVAECHGRLAGGVAYIGPNVAKAPFFNRQWPVVRMLVVGPDFRGKRIGHTLTAECIKWAIAQQLPAVNLSCGTDVSKTRWAPTRIVYERYAFATPTTGGRRPRHPAVQVPSASDQGGQLGARGDPELGIGLVQVVGDGAGGQEQLGGDVSVG